MCEAHNELKHMHTHIRPQLTQYENDCFVLHSIVECVCVCVRTNEKAVQACNSKRIYIVWNDTEYKILALAYSFIIMFCMKWNVHILSEMKEMEVFE